MAAYKKFRNLEFQNSQLQYGIQIAESLDDHSKAADYYKSLKPLIPEVQLRILQQQWLMALEILQQIRAAKYNRMLKKDVPVLFDSLKDHLDEMKERSGELLAELDEMKERSGGLLTDTESLQENIAWQVYNIRGAVRLVTAFTVLETEKNSKKVTGTMKEAISDFKSAIESADKSGAKNFEKNIPRWNLEILHGEQNIRKIVFSPIDSQQRLKLRNNLEAIIPEKGGYAPGEPLETRIEK